MSAVTSPLHVDDVLEELFAPCPSPTYAQVREWCERYPQFADDILEVSNDLLNMAIVDSIFEFDDRATDRDSKEIMLSVKIMNYFHARNMHEKFGSTAPFEAYGQRARLAREALGVSPSAIAKRMGHAFTTTMVKQIEDGTQQFYASLLEALSRALNVSMTYLLGSNTLQIAHYSKRHGLELGDAEMSRIKVEALDYAARYLELELLAGIETIAHDDPASPIAPLDIGSLAAAETAAATMRKRWKLGRKPIHSMIGLLEENGIKVLLTNLYTDVEGFALWIDENGAGKTQLIILGKSWHVARQRFTLAHELAHLLDREASETDADRFAGAFLMPKTVFVSRYKAQKVSIETLMAISEEFGVSLFSAIERLAELKLITDKTYKDLYEACKRRKGEAKTKRLDGFDETPRRFEMLRQQALEDGRIDASKAAELMGTTEESSTIH